MKYTESEARALVIQAGKRLLETGLIARTWGNVSARISESQFVITPSGMAYDTLKEEDLVVVNISDCSYFGSIKPSSEKGIHADAYRLRPDVNFVIHTHQTRASIVGVAGKALEDVPGEFKELLGERVPLAQYGMPSTDKLRKAVEKEYMAYPDSNAFMMIHHGAVFLGKDYEHAFAQSEALEELCRRVTHKKFRLYEGTANYSRHSLIESFIRSVGPGKMPDFVTDFGKSRRSGSCYQLTMSNGKVYTVDIKSGKPLNSDKLPRVSMIHTQIYKYSPTINFIEHITENDVIGYSVTGKPINPMLDDFAQIAGSKIKCESWNGSKKCAANIAKAINGKNVVLIKGLGAIATSSKESDLDAVKLVLNKECLTQMCSVFFGAGDSLNPLDCGIMRLVYVTKYSKKAE